MKINGQSYGLTPLTFDGRGEGNPADGFSVSARPNASDPVNVVRMLTSKICMFCGGCGGNGEHIVGEWILRYLDLYKMRSRIGFGVQRQSGEMDEIDAKQPLSSFKTDAICQACNNNWMSQLENKVKPLLTPLLQTPWPANDRPLFQSLFLHSAVITRWLIKTASTFGERMSVAVPENIRKALFQGRVFPGIRADVSCNAECGAYIGMSRSWNCYINEKIEVRELPARSFRFVLQLRHLAMRVSYFHSLEPFMTRPRHPVKLYPRFTIPPDYDSSGVARRSYHYETLEQLEHETTYAPPDSR